MLNHHNPLQNVDHQPYNIPDFTSLTAEDIRQALTTGLDIQSAEYQAIASHQDPATFENVVIALERSGELLRRSVNAFYLFDKNEATGYQIDRFDNSLFYGLEQVYNLNDRLLFSLGYSTSNFERESFYIPVTLTSISVFKFGVGVRV